MIADFLQVGGIQARIVIQAGELHIVEVKAGGIIQVLEILPAETPNGVRIEAEAQTFCRRGVKRPGRWRFFCF